MNQTRLDNARIARMLKDAQYHATEEARLLGLESPNDFIGMPEEQTREFCQFVTRLFFLECDISEISRLVGLSEELVHIALRTQLQDCADAIIANLPSLPRSNQ